jgi:hypothetical protein
VMVAKVVVVAVVVETEVVEVVMEAKVVGMEGVLVAL